MVHFSGNREMLCLDWTNISDCDRSRWVTGSAGVQIGGRLKEFTIGSLATCHVDIVPKIPMQAKFC